MHRNMYELFFFCVVALLMGELSVGSSVSGRSSMTAINPGPGNNRLSSLLQLPEDCGTSKVKPLRPSIGISIPAKKHSFPWMALIGRHYDQRTSWPCAGALITSMHVLTAASCVNLAFNPVNIVRLGEHRLSDASKSNVQDIKIGAIFPHEEYSTKTNDIAIVKLADEAVMGDTVFPICLPVQDDIQKSSFVGSIAMVAGWGKTGKTKDANIDRSQHYGSNVLKQILVQVASHEDCLENLKDFRVGDFLSRETHLCAGVQSGSSGITGGAGFCTGDSGAPLMLTKSGRTADKVYAIGIVSLSAGCDDVEHYGVYTRITFYLGWITNHLFK